MNILALETSSTNCSVALFWDGDIISKQVTDANQHAKVILPMIDELLSIAQTTVKKLDAIAFGCGPGSFTGLRIAASVVQGLALAHHIPVISISSLRTLAQHAYRAFHYKRVIAAIDARQQEIYAGIFEYEHATMTLIKNSKEVVCPHEQLILPETEDWYGIGTGWNVGGSYWATILNARLLDVQNDLLPDAVDVAYLASIEFANKNFLSPEQAIPVYLRDQVTTPPKDK